MAKLTDKVAFITGAASGIGRGITKVYAQQGAKLVLVDIADDVLDLASDLKAEGHSSVIAIQADLRNLDDLKKAVTQAKDKFGTIEILVANAGVCKLGKFLEMTAEDRDFHIDVNIKGTWNTIQAVLPEMKKITKVVL